MRDDRCPSIRANNQPINSYKTNPNDATPAITPNFRFTTRVVIAARDCS